MTLKEAQELIDAWTEKHAIRHNELTNMALLNEEIGKLAMLMGRRSGEAAGNSNFNTEVSNRLGDLLWTLLGIANQTGVDLTTALADTLQHKSSQTSEK